MCLSLLNVPPDRVELQLLLPPLGLLHHPLGHLDGLGVPAQPGLGPALVLGHQGEVAGVQLEDVEGIQAPEGDPR